MSDGQMILLGPGEVERVRCRTAKGRRRRRETAKDGVYIYRLSGSQVERYIERMSTPFKSHITYNLHRLIYPSQETILKRTVVISWRWSYLTGYDVVV